MIKAKITATGSYLPERIVTNKDFVREFGNQTSPKALERLLGTKEHRVAAESETCSDLLVKAAKPALSKATVNPEQLTWIIVSANPHEVIEPATACIVQGKLGAEHCPVFDIGASCTGWLTGVDVAARIIATSSKQEKILVLAGTLVNRILPTKIIQHKAIFGDGAGAVLLESGDDNGGCIYGSEFWCLGQHADIIHWPAPWSFHFKNVPKKFKGHFYMAEGYQGESKLLFRLAEIYLQQFAESLQKNIGFSMDEIDFAIVHQPSKPLFEKAVECLGIPENKTAYNFHRYGNTVSAELPITLDELVEEGTIKRGDLILLVTFGAGITIGAMLLRY